MSIGKQDFAPPELRNVSRETFRVNIDASANRDALNLLLKQND